MADVSEKTLLASAARTTTQTGDDMESRGYTTVYVVLDMTSAGTGSVTLSIEGKDQTSGKYYTLLAGSAVTSNSTNLYTVGPEIVASANAAASYYLPKIFRIKVTANNSNSATYSVGYTLMGR